LGQLTAKNIVGGTENNSIKITYGRHLHQIRIHLDFQYLKRPPFFGESKLCQATLLLPFQIPKKNSMD
jgi:hypothetical protein